MYHDNSDLNYSVSYFGILKCTMIYLNTGKDSKTLRSYFQIFLCYTGRYIFNQMKRT